MPLQLDVRDAAGASPLHLAADAPIAAVLLAADAPVNAVNNAGQCSAAAACRRCPADWTSALRLVQLAGGPGQAPVCCRAVVRSQHWGSRPELNGGMAVRCSGDAALRRGCGGRYGADPRAGPQRCAPGPAGRLRGDRPDQGVQQVGKQFIEYGFKALAMFCRPSLVAARVPARNWLHRWGVSVCQPPSCAGCWPLQGGRHGGRAVPAGGGRHGDPRGRRRPYRAARRCRGALEQFFFQPASTCTAICVLHVQLRPACPHHAPGCAPLTRAARAHASSQPDVLFCRPGMAWWCQRCLQLGQRRRCGCRTPRAIPPWCWPAATAMPR